MAFWLGVDPGRDKCGLAVCDDRAQLLHREIVPSADTLARTQHWHRRYGFQKLILGHSTTSRAWQNAMQTLGIPMVVVNESHSTEEARTRYWQVCPPQGWRRWVPLGLQTPPTPVDDLAAWILVERHLRQNAPQ
ncbi:MAG: resolvase [Oscillatoriales cyanobacterium SM2_1_8]|nr:resolvase [Oscillatoriales cyanobacterium SM2_1_8]